MLINTIGIDEERVVELDSWKDEPLTHPARRETLAMAVQAAVAAFAVGTPVAAEKSAMSEVSDITSQPATAGASRIDAA